MSHDALSHRWSRLAAALKIPEQAADHEYREIVLAYSQEHRAYHDLRHIAQVFEALDSVPVKDTAVETAVWFHDFVYRPGFPGNEQESAETAARVLARYGAEPAMISRVCELILATRNHAAGATDEKMSLFLDADLSILGVDEADYDQYACAVRREFGGMPTLLYRRGRRKFLEGMLQREAVFESDFFKNRLEARARGNMARELEKLCA